MDLRHESAFETKQDVSDVFAVEVERAPFVHEGGDRPDLAEEPIQVVDFVDQVQDDPSALGLSCTIGGPVIPARAPIR